MTTPDVAIRRLVALAVAIAGAVFACGEHLAPPNDSTEISVQLPPTEKSAALEAAVESFRLTVSGTGMEPQVHSLEVAEGMVTGLIQDIPAGRNRRFLIEGTDGDSTVVYRGSTIADVRAGSVTQVDVSLRAVAPLLRFSPNYTRLDDQGTGDSIIVCTLTARNLPELSLLDCLIEWDMDLLLPTGAFAGPDLPPGTEFDVTVAPTGLNSSVAGFSGSSIVDSNGDGSLLLFSFRRNRQPTSVNLATVRPVVMSLEGDSIDIDDVFTDYLNVALITDTTPRLNTPPTLSVPGDQLVTETRILSYTVTASDSQSVPSIEATGLPSGAQFTSSNGTGTFQWTPSLSQSGDYVVDFSAIDDSGAVDNASVPITVQDTCGVIFVADFNLDAIGSPPNTSLPGGPAGDFLSLLQGTGDSVWVTAEAGNLLNRPAIIQDSLTNPNPQGILRGTVSPGSTCHTHEVSWLSLVGHSISQFCRVELRDEDAFIIASVEFRAAGLITYNSAGNTVPVQYKPLSAQQFTVNIDYASQTTTLQINGNTVLAAQPFVQTASSLSTISCLAQSFDSVTPAVLVVDNLSVIGRF